MNRHALSLKPSKAILGFDEPTLVQLVTTDDRCEADIYDSWIYAFDRSEALLLERVSFNLLKCDLM